MIEVEGLVKRYTVYKRVAGTLRRRREEVSALDGLSFSVPRGSVTGFIGPNGAGKSTTVKILSGILWPDGGSCLVGGRVPWKERKAHVKRLGVVFGQRSQLWWDLPVSDSLALLGDMYGVPRARRDATIALLVAELELGSFLETPVRQLSLGQRMRCELAAALVHEPELLFLDEPTIGLDAPSKLALRGFVRRLNAERGLTVILTTHDMDDIDALADRVLLIGKGRALFDGTMAGLRREAGSRKRLVVDLVEPLRDGSDSRSTGGEGRSGAPSAAGAEAPAGLELVARSPMRLEFSFDPARIEAAKAIAYVASAYRAADLSIEGQPAEELIAALYKRHGV